MEALQSYLPSRVPSNVDFGAQRRRARWSAPSLAAALELAGAIDRWSRFRERWFVADARGALVLLALWPFALLFPAAVPLGLGQVFERLEAALAEWLLDTPFLEWLPVREIELQPLVPAAELLCVALGALMPCLLGYTVMRSVGRRAVFARGRGRAWASAATALSAALSWGPTHAWAWLSLPVQLGLVAALVLALLLLPVPRRGCAALLLLALVRAPEPAEPGAGQRVFRATRCRPGSRAASSASTAWRSGWAGSGLTRRWSMCCCASRAGERAT